MNGKVLSGPAAVLVVVLFFLPWINVSCDGVEVGELSGYEVATGVVPDEVSDQIAAGEVDGKPLLFIIPLVGVVTLALLGLTVWKSSFEVNAGWGQVIASLVGILILILEWLQVQGESEAAFDAVIEPALWGTVAGLVAIGAGAVFELIRSRRRPLALDFPPADSREQRHYQPAPMDASDDFMVQMDDGRTVLDDGLVDGGAYDGATILDDALVGDQQHANYTILDDDLVEGEGYGDHTILDDDLVEGGGYGDHTILDDDLVEGGGYGDHTILDEDLMDGGGYGDHTILDEDLVGSNAYEGATILDDELISQDPYVSPTGIPSSPVADHVEDATAVSEGLVWRKSDESPAPQRELTPDVESPREAEPPVPKAPVPPVDRTEILHVETETVAWLVISSGDRRGEQYQLFADTTIGRDLSNDIVIDETALSGNHARIKVENDRFFVFDQGSTNGVLLFNETANKWEKVDAVELHHGSKIKLGRIVLQLLVQLGG
jgi:hypothetical protein